MTKKINFQIPSQSTRFSERSSFRYISYVSLASSHLPIIPLNTLRRPFFAALIGGLTLSITIKVE